MTAIPEELKSRDAWVLWKRERRGKKDTKVPYSPTGRRASTTDPSTWFSFAVCDAELKAGRYDGLGYVLSDTDPFAAADLDGVRDPATGRIHPRAKWVIDALNSYTEISQSGRGLHIFVRGKLRPGRRRKKAFEVYSASRFIAITGDRYTGTPATVEHRQAELDEVYKQVFGVEQEKNVVVRKAFASAEDDEVIRKASAAENGYKFRRLWCGDCTGYPSQSEADAALCLMLAYWTNNDADQVDRLFRRSKLMRPKWDQSRGLGRTYGSLTIASAISRN